MEAEAVIPFEETFDGVYGLEVHESTDELVRGSVRVSNTVKQSHGIVHGGLYAAMAESLASEATHLAAVRDGRIAMGMSNATSFLRPVSEGTIHATARRVHAGRSTWVWDVEFTDDAGRRCAITRMMIAVR
jgi:uncharacterized protein (TIGR00369 family)